MESGAPSPLPVNPSRGPIPDRPAQRFSQNAAVSRPSAETAPIPVITMRRAMLSSAVRLLRQKLFYAVNRLAHCANLLGCLIRNLNIELVLQGKKDVHSIERVDAQLLV